MRLVIKPTDGYPDKTDFEIFNGDFLIAHFTWDHGTHRVFMGFNGFHVLSNKSCYFSLTPDMFATYCAYFADDYYALKIVRYQTKKRAI